MKNWVCVRQKLQLYEQKIISERFLKQLNWIRGITITVTIHRTSKKSNTSIFFMNFDNIILNTILIINKRSHNYYGAFDRCCLR